MTNLLAGEKDCEDHCDPSCSGRMSAPQPGDMLADLDVTLPPLLLSTAS